MSKLINKVKFYYSMAPMVWAMTRYKISNWIKAE